MTLLNSMEVEVKVLKALLLVSLFSLPVVSVSETIEWSDGSEEINSSDNYESVVEIYVTSWCPYCRKAMDFMDSHGIPYNSYDIEEDLDAAARKKALAPNYTGIPLAVINGKIIKGFTKERYSADFKNVEE